jgi:phosphotriesterase-related protein
MVNLFVRDITEGIARTGIRAGVIKCATDRAGMTPGVERVLRACAQAHRATGTPITTHTHAASRRGLEQQEVFRSEGVDLSRVVIGHSGDTDDLGYLEELIANGSILGMDRFGIDGYLPTAKRVEVIAELCRRGYADRMVLSHDASCYLDWIPGEIPPSTMPHWHYLHISHDVLPLLREAGVTDAQIDTMLIDTPRRFLEGGAPY